MKLNLMAGIAATIQLHPVRASQKPMATDPGCIVPGNNTLVYCQDPAVYPFEVEYINFEPNPPKAGSNLTVKAQGLLGTRIDQGSELVLNVQLRVGRSLVEVFKQEYDLCEQMPQFNLSCPLEKGNVSIETEIELPADIPPGTYSVLVDALTAGSEEIVCVKTDLSV